MRYARFLVRPARDEFDVGLTVILGTLDPVAPRGSSSHDLRTEYKTISKARIIGEGNCMHDWRHYLHSKLTRKDSVSLFSTNDV